MTPSTWTPTSWQDRPAAQQPAWPDAAALAQAEKTLSTLPPLVFAGEARALTKQLAAVAAGEAFVLQAGDCAESFHDFSADSIRDKLRVILQMAVVLTYGSGVPVIKLGRMAGQFGKPRSADTEVINGVTLPSFRGHIVNDDAPDAEARIPDPSRLLAAYHQAASTLNLVRAFAHGGFADLSQVHTWNQQFVASSAEGRRYDEVAAEIDRALRFMKACGIDLTAEAALHQVDFYTSHEALVLGYEEALTRKDSLTGDYYDCSAHFVWIGERTRQLDGAHVEFFRGIKNPIGVKLGPTADPAEVKTLVETLNPDNEPGRLTLITRFGADKIADGLPRLIDALGEAGAIVTWLCDPMHGNTFTSASGVKTRHLDQVMNEVEGFFSVHRAHGTWPGGIHVELTGEDVTECLGGAEVIGEGDLATNYTTMCDPRLNGRQSLDLAFRVAELLRGN
ncbi:MAG: 3-deoxy-7-phosphoheptulonate synthase [Actinomycetota bacterium]